jgi:chromosome segregation ATPase
MELKQAIESLDPKNDEVWTENGLPKLEVVKELTGKSYSRKEVTDAAPLHTRERLLKGMSTETKPAEADVSKDPEVKVEAAPVEEKPSKADVTVETLQLEIEGAQAQLAQMEAFEVRFLEQKRDLTARIDKLQTEQDNLRPKHSSTHEIMRYLEQSKKDRADRVERMKNAGISDLDKRLQTRPRNPRPLMG